MQVAFSEPSYSSSKSAIPVTHQQRITHHAYGGHKVQREDKAENKTNAVSQQLRTGVSLNTLISREF